MIWQILLLFLIAVLIRYRWKKRRLINSTKQMKNNVKMLPIIGHGYQFMGTDEERMSAIHLHGREALKHSGDLSCVWLGYRLYVKIVDPVLADWALRTCMEKDDAFKIGKSLTGDVLALASVPLWRHRRKIFTPNFSPRNLNQFVEIFSRQSKIFADKIGSACNSGPLQLWSYIIRFTLDNLFESTLGVHARAQQDSNQPLLRALKPVGPLFAARMTQPWLHSDFVYRMLPAYSTFLKVKQAVYAVIKQIIHSKREELRTKPKQGAIKTLLETMIEAERDGEKEFTEEELEGEVIGLYVAGVDTSATTIGFCLHMVARHPDVQEKIVEELEKVLGESKDVTSEDLPKLKYLEAMIKETMRLYPPATVISRNVGEDVITPSGITLVKGSNVAVNIWALHRNQEYWGADAEEFRPERFFDTPLKHPAQYMPFSYGPRNCIGSQYAMMALKTVLATLLRRFRVLPAYAPAEDGSAPPLRVRFDVVIKDADKFTLVFKPRDL